MSSAGVLVATPLLTKPGGVSQYFRVLIPHFRMQISFFTNGARRDNGGPLITLLRLVADWKQFAKALRTSTPDLVHLNPSLGMKALLRDGVSLLIAKAWAKPVLIFFHGWDEDCEHVVRRSAWLFRSIYGRASAFVVLAREFETRLRTLGISAPIFRLMAPVEDGMFALADTGKEPGLEFRILYLARVERAKGIFEALDAYAIVKHTFPLASLVVAGDGADLEAARAYAREICLEDVSFRGHLSGREKSDAFQEAAVYLFASRSEGLPISVLEAMAQGRPIVSTAVGGIGDFFIDGTMGFLSANSCPPTLATLLCRLLGDRELQRTMGSFNARYASRYFRAESVAEDLENIYRSLIPSLAS